MTAESFDLDRWVQLFPLEKEDKRYLSGGGITSPHDLAIVEQIRSQISQGCELGTSIPTDVFVFGIGESPHRESTKIGGTPYRPRNLPWPTTADGKSATFLCQFCFAESKDLTGPLPGDVLLIFALRPDVAWYLPDMPLLFEWHPLGLKDLIPPEDVPAPEWTFVTCFGTRHRTSDFVDPRLDDIVYDWLPVESCAKNRPPYFAAVGISRICGVKIGGAPVWPHPERSHDFPGRFLCSLTSLVASPDTPFPWINQPEPLSFKNYYSPELCLRWADGEVFNFYLDDAGSIVWSCEFW